MFEDFKLFGTSRQERMTRGLLIGIPAAILLGTLYGAVMHYSNMRIEFEFIIVGLGLAMANVVKYITHGVQKQFGYLAAGLTVLCLLVADMVTIFGFRVFDFGLFFSLRVTIQMYFTGIQYSVLSGALSLLFRGMAIFYAYQNGRAR